VSCSAPHIGAEQGNKNKMERTTKTFIGGLVIGSVIGGLITYCLMANYIINFLMTF